MSYRRSLFSMLLVAAFAVSPLFSADAPAAATTTDRPAHIVPAPGKDLTVLTPAGGKPATIDLSKLKLPADANEPAKASEGGAKTAKPKGVKADPAGVWKWTTRNRNGQSIESRVQISVDKKGAIMGTLLDRSGVHPITNPVVNEDTLTFTVLHESPGIDPVPVTYTVNLDRNDPKVSIERPDFSAEGKAAGKKRKSEAAAVHAAE